MNKNFKPIESTLPDDDWDREMKADTEAGKLDFLLRETDEALRLSLIRPIDDLCRKP